MNDIAGASEASASRASRGFQEEALLSNLRKNLQRKGKNDCNLRRSMKRNLLKSVKWPKLYVQDVRCWDPKTEKEELMPLAFILPQEILSLVAEKSDPEVLMSTERMDPLSKAHLQKCEAAAGEKLLGMGIWGDGVPCQWDRTESVDVLSFNLPGLGGAWKNLRIPITALPHAFVGEHTWHDIMKVVQECLVACATGIHWTRRPDEQPWRQGDSYHAKRAGKPIGVRAALVEVRGDWKFYKEVFHFPTWNEKAGCCWTCTCTPSQVRKHNHGSYHFCSRAPREERVIILKSYHSLACCM